MAVGDVMKIGYGLKQIVTIMTVDPLTLTVEAALKDGGSIQIPIWNVGAAFRWPIEGETWTVRKDGGYWALDSHSPETDQFQINLMTPGDLKLDAVGQVYLADGTIVTRKYSVVIGDSINTTYTIGHNLGTMDVSITIRENAVPADLVFLDIARITDANTVTLTFASAPDVSSYVVTVIG